VTSLARKTWRITAAAAAAIVILLAVLVGAFRLVLTQVPEYRDQIGNFLSDRFALDVAFATLDARFRHYGPELVFTDVYVRSADGRSVLAKARRGSVSLDVVGSLRSGHLVAGRAQLEGPELALIRGPDGRFRLAGQDALSKPEQARGLTLDGIRIGHLRVVDARLSFVDETRATPVRVFESITLELKRDRRDITVAGRGMLPDDLGGELDFEARASGDLAASQTLPWQFELTATRVELAAWRDLVRLGAPNPAGGTADLELHGELTGTRLTRLAGQAAVSGLELVPVARTEALPAPAPMEQPADHPVADSVAVLIAARPARPDPARFAQFAPPRRLEYARVASRFELEVDPDAARRRIVLSDLEITVGDRRMSPARIELEGSGPSSEGWSASGRADRIELAVIWPLLGLLPDGPVTRRLLAADATGTVTEVSFEARRQNGGPLAFSAAAHFDALRTRPFAKVPGFAGLAGRIEASDFGGRLDLDATNFSIDLPRWYLTAIDLSQAEGTVTWRRSNAGWRVLTSELRLEVPGARARGSFELALTGAGSAPTLDAAATLRDVDVGVVERYVPIGRVRPRFAAWLSQALVAGKVPTAELSYHGPIGPDAFAADGTQFELHAPVVDATFAYRSDLPPLTAASGELEFRNRSISGRLETGTVGATRLTQGRFRIPDAKAPIVAVEARGRGSLAPALRDLQASTIGTRLGPLFNRLRADGVADARVELAIPVRRPQESHFSIRLDLKGDRVGLDATRLVATDLRGRLDIVDGALASDGLDGRTLGGPFHFVAEAGPALNGGRPETSFSAEGRLSAAALADLVGHAQMQRFSGATDWHLAGTIESSPRGVRPVQHYVLTSDLGGLGVGFPAPLEKPATVAESFRAEVDYDGADAIQLRAATRDARALARFVQQDDAWTVERGALRFDGRAAALPDQAGLRIEGAIERVDLSAWLALRADVEAPRWRARDVLAAANVRIGSLGIWGYDFADVRGLLVRTDAGWQVDVAGPDAEGRLVIPYDATGDAPFVADLKTLSVRERGQMDARTGDTADPRRIPAIDARVGALTYGHFALGETRLHATRDPDGLRIETLVSQSDSHRGELSGSWLKRPEGEVTAVDFTLTTSDVEATMHAFGYPNAMTGTRGFLRGNLEWPGHPERDALTRASGSLRIELEDGQVLNVEPGAGRLLGLMSIAALPRRLALDFSDLTDKGLAFDSITGDFELDRGSARTDNLLLRGPAAEVGIAGRTDLGTREYDQTAVVTGNLGASLGVAGALAGGPAVGAALLLFSQIFKEPLKGMTRGYYRISGSWDDPVVERLGTGDEGGGAQTARADRTAATNRAARD
jgi:uncharacterized protein (TIGR02099 family)